MFSSVCHPLFLSPDQQHVIAVYTGLSYCGCSCWSVHHHQWLPAYFCISKSFIPDILLDSSTSCQRDLCYSGMTISAAFALNISLIYILKNHIIAPENISNLQNMTSCIFGPLIQLRNFRFTDKQNEKGTSSHRVMVHFCL